MERLLTLRRRALHPRHARRAGPAGPDGPTPRGTAGRTQDAPYPPDTRTATQWRTLGQGLHKAAHLSEGGERGEGGRTSATSGAAVPHRRTEPRAPIPVRTMKIDNLAEDAAQQRSSPDGQQPRRHWAPFPGFVPFSVVSLLGLLGSTSQLRSDMCMCTAQTGFPERRIAPRLQAECSGGAKSNVAGVECAKSAGRLRTREKSVTTV